MNKDEKREFYKQLRERIKQLRMEHLFEEPCSLYEPDWDDDTVRKAAEHCVLYMDVRIKPAKLRKHLDQFKDSYYL